MIEFGHATHLGLRREHNEDTYWADADSGLFLVADGMGGPGRGEVAAALLRDALVAAARTGGDLASAIRAAGVAIATRAATPAGLPPMGAALALLQTSHGEFHAYCVGDSRVSAWRHGGSVPLEAMNPPGPEPGLEPADVPATAVLSLHKRRTQAVGITPAAELCSVPVTGVLERGMQFLLCSDGLTEALDVATVGALLARPELAAQECVDQLLLAALDAGSPDNITALLVRTT